MFWKTFAVFAILGSVLYVSSGHSFALGTQNIGIFPSIVNKSLKPGSSLSSSLYVTNHGLLGYSYSVYATPYGVRSETYQPVFKKLPGFTNISSWFNFNRQSGFLSPGQSSMVNYTINVPNGTPPGSYYAAVFAETSPTSEKTGNKEELQIFQRVGSLFYINILGKAYQNGSVSSWHTPFFQSSPINASLKLSNSGKLYYVSSVNIYFEDLLGNVKYQYQTQKIVIPKVIRNIQIVWPKPPIFGLYKVRGTATVYGQKYLTTRYVLIVSTTMRWIFVFIIATGIIYLGVQNILINIFRGRSEKTKNIK